MPGQGHRRALARLKNVTIRGQIYLGQLMARRLSPCARDSFTAAEIDKRPGEPLRCALLPEQRISDASHYFHNGSLAAKPRLSFVWPLLVHHIRSNCEEDGRRQGHQGFSVWPIMGRKPPRIRNVRLRLRTSQRGPCPNPSFLTRFPSGPNQKATCQSPRTAIIPATGDPHTIFSGG